MFNDEITVNRFSRPVRVSVCALNQWALDWDGNLRRVITAVKKAHSLGSSIHVGVELELSGYSCLDHFYEGDTVVHCWESLSKLLEVTADLNMVVVTGMPIRFGPALYNCMLVLAAGRIVLIHPKSALCDDDVYRESRYFKSWKHGLTTVSYDVRQHGIDQDPVPFGHGIVVTGDGVTIAVEICEELWAAVNPAVKWALAGVDVVCNGSASHHVLGKSAKRICQLVQDASTKIGGIYLYSNLRGFDGDRIYFDGMSAIVQNGVIYEQIQQFDLEDVAVASATLDLNATVAYRAKIASLCELASREPILFRHDAGINVIVHSPTSGAITTPAIINFMTPGQELFHAPAAYLWHYLRRSTAAGYFLSLSGGADSASVAAMVYLMCEKVCKAVADAKTRGVAPDESLYLHGKPVEETDPRLLCKRLFSTAYMQTTNSSDETRTRAAGIAEAIGANFVVQNIDEIVTAYTSTITTSSGAVLTHDHEDRRAQLALENIQARARMALAYLNAQVLPITTGTPGSLLVLGSSNVDESLVGYLTKFDCSAADINPIGSINKRDLKTFLVDFTKHTGFGVFKEVVEATPTAELRPATADRPPQTDEEDIGMTYEQLAEIGLLRKPGYKGILGTFYDLVNRWKPATPTSIAETLVNFYTRYFRNRHKATVATPALVSNNYCVDDHRTDHRPFVYPSMQHTFDRLRTIAAAMIEEQAKE